MDLLKKIILASLPVMIIVFIFIASKNAVYNTNDTFSIYYILNKLEGVHFVSNFNVFEQIQDSIDKFDVTNFGTYLLSLGSVFISFFSFIFNVVSLPFKCMYDLFQIIRAFII